MVQSNQGAFVKGRSIAHNIMIFQDLIKNYGRSATSPRCAIKIDISKAYDTVDWWFIEDLLKALCFPVRFIKWIMTCLENTSYYLLLNGRVQGKFKGEKGLRQGDPLSPLLFVLIMEYLTRRLQLAALDTSFRYHPMCKSLNLLSLCFADDSLLFCKGSMVIVRVIKSALEEFSAITGL
ncbi:secreted RxLR effector protein 78-like [Humulus lupulus]|uniref:secreted RxLR effector protein 78-like n=1 Tax=Humulus lupulus TaxID=3486 RepID=UPI002B403369|nr:secreted RxLR effector protein 78-like [Humulus lupulus]